MVDAPLNIRRFEALQLVSITVGLIHGFAAVKDDLFATVAGAVIGVVLTLLVSRGRKDWARWVLLAMFVVGLVIMVWQARVVFSLGYPLVTAAIWLIQAVALALLFTPQSANWLKTTEPQA